MSSMHRVWSLPQDTCSTRRLITTKTSMGRGWTWTVSSVADSLVVGEGEGEEEEEEGVDDEEECSPWPNLPSLDMPHVNSNPSAVMQAEWWSPVATCTTRSGLPLSPLPPSWLLATAMVTIEGNAESEIVVAPPLMKCLTLPNWPYVPSPNVNRVPPSVQHMEWVRPAEICWNIAL